MKKRSTIYAIPLLLIIPIFILLNSCKDDEVTIPNPIEEIKGPDWRNNIGQAVELEAYLALKPQPCLYYNFEDRLENRATPENRYIRLDLSMDVLPALGEQFHGAKVSVKGIIAEDQTASAESLTELLGESYGCILEVFEMPDIMEATDVIYPVPFHPCEITPALCELQIPTAPETYVLIYSGGINANKAYMRYWNDMVFFHSIITAVLGVDVANIKVVYKDGFPETNYMSVDYEASPTGLNDALNWFREYVDDNDQFVFFATNHGGSGWEDTNNDEIYSEDEFMSYYDQNTSVKDDWLAEKINSIDFEEFIGIFEPCNAGGLIYDLRGPNRVLISASTEDQSSYGGVSNAGLYFDDFVYHFTCALGEQRPDGFPVSADNNFNNKVSLAEAYRYAISHDSAPETPQIDSDGNGLPSYREYDESGIYAEGVHIGD